jgi:hypothetical protein
MTRPRRVLDLFSGLRGWSDPWEEKGWETLTLDLDPKFEADIVADILTVRPRDFPWKPDVILASPPCEGFSVMRIGKNWTRPDEDPPNAPKTEHAELSMKIVQRTVGLIRYFKPRFYVIENPRAKLRRLMEGWYPEMERHSVWYCHWKEDRAKPTDLWGGFPASFDPRKECHNQNPSHPDDCCCRDHRGAVRGSVTGTQGMSSEEAAKIPRALSLGVLRAVERNWNERTRWFP